MEDSDTPTITLFVLDRDREVNYNGYDYRANMYRCGWCRHQSIMGTDIRIKYCCACGAKFDEVEDSPWVDGRGFRHDGRF